MKIRLADRAFQAIAGLALAVATAGAAAAEHWNNPATPDPSFPIMEEFDGPGCGLEPVEVAQLQREAAAISDLVVECDELASDPQGQIADEHLERWLEIQARVGRVERTLESTRDGSPAGEPLEQTVRELDRASSATTSEIEKNGIRDQGDYANALADVYTLAQELSRGVDELSLCGPLAWAR